MTLGLAALLFIVPVSVFVPGFALIRGFSLPDELRLAVSVAVSLALIYLLGFALYLADAGAAAYVASVIAFLVVTILARRELLAFLRRPSVGAILVHWAILASWLLLLTLAVRNLSGGGWWGDWAEHYERAVFFCGGLPLSTEFTGAWSLTARPPLNNVVVAFFLEIAGTEFASYQLTAVLIGSLEFLGAATLWCVLAGGHRRWAGLLVLTVLLGLNPSIVQNVTYTWTRPLTNFFLLSAAALYLLAIRDGALAHRRWSYLLLGLALVTHYSTVPYLIALGALEARFLLTRRLAPSEAILCVLLVAAPAAPWLAFAFDRFGVAGTFLTNSTVAWNAPLGRARIVARALGNIVSTFVPHPLRDVKPLWEQEYALGYARDFTFLIYQVSLPVLMGSVGGATVAWLLAKGAYRRLRERRLEPVLLGALFLTIVVFLGIVTVADDDAYGVAHVCLQPLGAAGLVYLASRWTTLPFWLRSGLGVGLLIDATLGIGLNFWMLHLSLDDLIRLSPDRLLVTANLTQNLVAKAQWGYAFLGDLALRNAAAGALGSALLALLALATSRAVTEIRRGDAADASSP